MKKLVLVVSLLLISGVAAADDIAGRVQQVNRPQKSFTITPYKSYGIQVMQMKVSTNTKYSFSPPIQTKTLPSFSNVHKGSWVRITHQNGVASQVIIHTNQK
jgi:hypothetical protein